MRQVFCVNILDFLSCANLIILYYILFIGSFKLIFKQLQYFGGGLIEATLHPLRVRTLQNRVIVAYEALKRIFIRKLLFGLRVVPQTFVASLDDICSVNTFLDCYWKFVKLIQTFHGEFEDSCKFRIVLLYFPGNTANAFLVLASDAVRYILYRLSRTFLCFLLRMYHGNCT